MFTLNVAAKSPDVHLPKYGTSLSTCFDLEFFATERAVEGFNRYNEKVARYVNEHDEIMIYPGDRLMIPTGLVMKLEYVPTIESYRDILNDSIDLKHFSIRLHARSGLSLKRGLILANSEGIVDADYQQEIFVLLMNVSEVTQTIAKHDRIAQGEVVGNVPFNLIKLNHVPTPHSERSGGFGSTGIVG